MRHLLLVVGFVVAVLPSLARAEAGGRSGYEGVYVHSGGARDRAGLRSGIEGVVGRMSVLVRGIARARLAERVTISPRVAVVRRGDGLYLEHEPIPPRRITADGEPVVLTSAFGERLRVSTRGRGRTVLEAISYRGSRRQNTYRFSPEGRRLRLSVDVRSPLMPRPLEFSLSYARR